MRAEIDRPARLAAWLALMTCASSIGWHIFRTSDAGARLYWEYAGRLLHRPVTSGYIEWVQHRVGSPPAVETATLLSGSAAPYSGFPAEYPPGALMLFAAIRKMGESLLAFETVLMLLMGVVAILMSGIALRLRAQLRPAGNAEPLWVLAPAMAFAAIWPLLVGSFTVIRFDVVPAVLTIGGIALAVQGRSAWGGALLGLGAAVKLWPALLLPLLFAHLWFSGRKRAAIIAMVAGAAGLLLPHSIMLLLGTAPASLLGYLSYLGERPPQVESMVANLLTSWAHLVGLPVNNAFDFGSHNIEVAGATHWIRGASVLNAASLICLFALVCWRTARTQDAHERAHTLVTACAAAVGVTMLCSRVFSGEYLLWLIPFAIALSASRLGIVALCLFVFSLLALRATYAVYPLVTSGTFEGTLISLSKNVLLLLAIFTLGISLLWRGGRQTAPSN